MISTDHILSTKLAMPASPAHMVERERLMARQTAPFLVLVCAPAGYGKTTLITAWARQTTARVAWLALDAGDNDPTRFFMHLVRTVQAQFPGFGQALGEVLESAQPPAIASLMPALVNQLSHLPENLCLMLDDLHLVTEPAVHEALAFVAEQQPPGLQLVIASRHDPAFPLARLRAQRRLLELRTEDLRFTAEETECFCNGVMRLGLSREQIGTLDSRTEGWIVGLQLAALSLHDHPDKSDFIRSFAGDDRHITDFLMDEVLRSRREDIQDFLLQTSLLDRFCAPLCDAVTGGSHGRTMIDELERSNMFIIGLDHKRLWYRYHHLVASLLLTRLQQTRPALIGQTHRAASQWFAAQGLFSEAIEHAIKAGEFETAADMMEQHSAEIFSLGRFVTALAWARLLPDRVMARRPKLAMTCAWGGLVMDNPTEVRRHIRIAGDCMSGFETAAPGSEARMMYGQLAVIQGSQYCLEGNLEGAVASVTLALESLRPGRVLYRAAAVCRGFCHYFSGELDAAQRLFEANASIADAGHNLIVPTLSVLGLARSHLLRGRLQTAQHVYERAIQECLSLGWQEAPACGMLHIGLGEIALERNDLAAAEQHLSRGVDMTRAGRVQYVNAWGRVLLAQTRLAAGHAGSVLPLAEEQDLLRYAGRFVIDIPPLSAALARLWHHQGRADLLQRWTELAGLPLDAPWLPQREAEYLMLARLLLDASRPEEAAALLDHILKDAAAGQRLRVLMEAGLLRARGLLLTGDTAAAVRYLEQALAQADHTDFLRLFLNDADLLAELLPQIRPDSPASAQARRLRPLLPEQQSTGAEPAAPDTSLLSRKEAQVAEYIAQGLSSQEIADLLFVSVNTIKTHTKNIYRKLGVHRRVRAVDQLRKL